MPLATPYLFDGADLVGEQLSALTESLDPWTRQGLLETGIGPGWTVADAGAGSGTIATWMADQIGDRGTVVALDINLDHLPEHPGVKLVQKDLTSGVISGGPYDLIHSRLLTIHLPQRVQMIRGWADALKPGGQLVLHEFDCTWPRPVYCDSPEDAALFTKVSDSINDLLRQVKVDLAWGSVAHKVFRQVGLTGVRTEFHAETFHGGQSWARWAAINTLQKQDQLLALDSGLTKQELERFRELMADPTFAATSYLAARITGRRPNRQ
ncbi:MAG TPA: hypothetical protein DGT23_09760 [Micromonosporaceae bacterium]|nr:hypothetical protein [Micromonosporaceae bacterium]